LHNISPQKDKAVFSLKETDVLSKDFVPRKDFILRRNYTVKKLVVFSPSGNNLTQGTLMPHMQETSWGTSRIKKNVFFFTSSVPSTAWTPFKRIPYVKIDWKPRGDI
jgi:hypothetical protein